MKDSSIIVLHYWSVLCTVETMEFMTMIRQNDFFFGLNYLDNSQSKRIKYVNNVSLKSYKFSCKIIKV